MALMEQWLPLIWPSAHNCPVPMVYDHVRNAAEEFCKRTRAWRFRATLDMSTVTGGGGGGGGLPYVLPFALGGSGGGGGTSSVVELYTPQTPPGTVVFELEKAFLNGTTELCPVSYDDHTPEEWVLDSTPREICQVVPGGFILFGRGDGSGQLMLSMFLKPDSGNAPFDLELPDWMFQSFGRLIADGALARILALPEKSWTNPETAAHHLARFEAGCDRNFALNRRGQQRAPIRTQARFI